MPQSKCLNVVWIKTTNTQYSLSRSFSGGVWTVQWSDLDNFLLDLWHLVILPHWLGNKANFSQPPLFFPLLCRIYKQWLLLLLPPCFISNRQHKTKMGFCLCDSKEVEKRVMVTVATISIQHISKKLIYFTKFDLKSESHIHTGQELMIG